MLTSESDEAAGIQPPQPVISQRGRADVHEVPLRSAQGRWIRRRDGFTFIELLVILSILGIGVYFASVGTAGQAAYYGLRGDVERIVSAIQRACIQSASRGDVRINPGNREITAGVTFYRDQMGPRFQVLANAPSFLGWFDDLPALNPEAMVEPVAGTIGGLDDRGRTYSRSLRTDTVLTRAFVGLPPAPLPNGAMLRYRNGRLDVFRENGSVGGGILAQLNANFTPVASPLGGVTTAWTFDVVNSNVGWVRIRCLSGGFVEVSGINPLTAGVPTNVVGGVF